MKNNTFVYTDKFFHALSSPEYTMCCQLSIYDLRIWHRLNHTNCLLKKFLIFWESKKAEEMLMILRAEMDAGQINPAQVFLRPFLVSHLR